MVVNVVTLYVKPAHIGDFIAATLDNRRCSRAEPGNRRFDVIQGSDDPARFVLYEAFDSREAVEVHRTLPHVQVWKKVVEPWMARPRETHWHTVLAPAAPADW